MPLFKHFLTFNFTKANYFKIFDVSFGCNSSYKKIKRMQRGLLIIVGFLFFLMLILKIVHPLFLLLPSIYLVIPIQLGLVHPFNV